jgi:deoxyribodipyrimidine photo-lyase
LLVTTDDLHAESLALDGIAIDAAIIAADPALLWGDKARAFVGLAAADCAARTSAHFGCPADTLNAIDTTALVSAARAAGVGQIVTAYAPVGPVADALRHAGQALAGEGVSLVQLRRPWDQQFWPHANKGFFPFKEQIPVLLRGAAARLFFGHETTSLSRNPVG